ncbi:DUF551 domain-containing protein [Atlantibacter hermannii]|uniref:DUF551 domain-containing protein n=1 Tax=Atlantibacter hermannii TaxID=565 RepID=UPI0028B17A5A|nr:DUF551 domain-containing protein [Atlantibacter hermannii]
MTLTRERLNELANAEYCKSDPGKWLLGLKEVNALAQMALSALESRADAEPVGYYRLADDGVSYYLSSPTDHRDGCIPLYTRPQPAPVVVDFKNLARELVENLVDCNGADDSAVKQYQKWAEKTCRAAMLQGKDEPVPGWIPCSERMPDDDDFVYIWPRPDFGTELHVGQYCKFHKKGAGWYAQVNEQNYGIEWHPITVTHWMPLPATPFR